ncbi:MAG: hypothetical protein V7L26_10295 [Nostoc sp.]
MSDRLTENLKNKAIACYVRSPYKKPQNKAIACCERVSDRLSEDLKNKA